MPNPPKPPIIHSIDPAGWIGWNLTHIRHRPRRGAYFYTQQCASVCAQYTTSDLTLKDIKSARTIARHACYAATSTPPADALVPPSFRSRSSFNFRIRSLMALFLSSTEISSAAALRSFRAASPRVCTLF
mmetsp:Transcript_24763/g.72529  ORF Transcript_24763/g.72529 Transcript_24763/m.72529 type:complete len:130 (+) Transcript_24763:104-493(+)